MDYGLLIAQTQQHGPPHVLILGVLAIAIVGWLVYKAVTGRNSPDDDSQRDRGPEL